VGVVIEAHLRHSPIWAVFILTSGRITYTLVIRNRNGTTQLVMILAGDIGGTKTLLALFDDASGTAQLLRDATFASQEAASLEAILTRFLGATSTPLRAACFGVPGVVIDGRCETTNLPWHLEERLLAQQTGAPRVKLLNDLEAAAYGMLHLEARELASLNDAAQPRRPGNIAVIAAGTGLGQAMLIWDGAQHHPVASEGGHADFAPRTDQEVELLLYLRRLFNGHVSYERVLTGPGLHNIYTFLRDTGYAPEPAWLAERLATGDASAAIAEVGLAGGAALCVAALDLFAAAYGAEAGNMALRCLAIGGVFVGGGIAPKILPALRRGPFMHAFAAKGRFAELLQSIPVHVALNQRAPLLGAVHYALRLASSAAR
jgi:glucokinase